MVIFNIKKRIQTIKIQQIIFYSEPIIPAHFQSYYLMSIKLHTQKRNLEGASFYTFSKTTLIKNI